MMAKIHILDAIAEAAIFLKNDDVSGADLATAAMGETLFGLRLKPLSLYFPDQLLPISKPGDLKDLLGRFGQDTSGDQLALNVRLLHHLRNPARCQWV